MSGYKPYKLIPEKHYQDLVTKKNVKLCHQKKTKGIMKIMKGL